MVKGMEIIIREHRLWPQKGLNTQCKGFKCVAGKKIAVAVGYYSHSLTLRTKNHT